MTRRVSGILLTRINYSSYPTESGAPIHSFIAMLYRLQTAVRQPRQCLRRAPA